MAGQATQPFHEEHARLLEHVDHIAVAARQLPELSLEERVELADGILDFLSTVLAPHAEAEERVLYPEVARLLGHPQATAPMVFDHVAIRDRIGALADADPADVALMQEQLYGLAALIRVHFQKEEELYLPLLEAEAGPRLVAILEEMGRLEHTR